MIDQLTPKDPLLAEIGTMFTNVGIAESALKAFKKLGNIQMAIDACVKLNKV